VSWEEGVFTATITSEKASATDCGDGVDLILIIDGKVKRNSFKMLRLYRLVIRELL
jgi:hypothetical protein